MVQATVLKVADPFKLFMMQTDGSEVGLRAFLSQKDHDDNEYPVAYGSRKLLPREVNYATIEKECLAILGPQILLHLPVWHRASQLRSLCHGYTE